MSRQKIDSTSRKQFLQNLFEPVFHKTSYIHPLASITGNVKIGRYVFISPFASIRGDIEEILIGDYSNIQDSCTIHTSKNLPVKIGRYVTVGHGAIIHGAVIKDNVLIGMNATVLDGTVIESNTLIAAGSLVREGERIEGGWLYAGLPAKKIRKLKKQEVYKIIRNAKSYAKLIEKYKRGTFGSL